MLGKSIHLVGGQDVARYFEGDPVSKKIDVI